MPGDIELLVNSCNREVVTCNTVEPQADRVHIVI